GFVALIGGTIIIGAIALFIMGLVFAGIGLLVGSFVLWLLNGFRRARRLNMLREKQYEHNKRNSNVGSAE
ncbi:MAG: hypothetical protein VYD64_05940, partial [Pseudomonadota bacterium]|nr:hypothetical protein [Pseudomonadota bacterium]